MDRSAMTGNAAELSGELLRFRERYSKEEDYDSALKVVLEDIEKAVFAEEDSITVDVGLLDKVELAIRIIRRGSPYVSGIDLTEEGTKSLRISVKQIEEEK